MTVPEPEVITPTPVKETPIDLSSEDEETEEPVKEEDMDEAEVIANEVFGNAIKRLTDAKKIDEIDEKVKQLCVKILGEAKSNLTKAIAKGLSRKFKKSLRREMEKLVEDNEVKESHRWATNLLSSEIESVFIGLIPVGRVDASKYLVGTETKVLSLRENGLFMRTGGGFIKMSEFIRGHAREQCLKLRSTMKKKNLSYQKATVSFSGNDSLEAKKVSDEAIVAAFNALLRVYERRQEIEEAAKINRQNKKALSNKKDWFSTMSTAASTTTVSPQKKNTSEFQVFLCDPKKDSQGSGHNAADPHKYDAVRKNTQPKKT